MYRIELSKRAMRDLRRGEYRVVYRPLTAAELKALRAAETAGFLVERIVDRRDLEKAAATLPS